MKTMKTKKTMIGLGMMLIALLIVSCEKETQTDTELSYGEQIAGTYTGTFSIDGLKSGTDAFAEVEMNSDSSIWVHCYGGEIDTTFMLEIFENNDSIMVCLTGDDFFNEYGHMSGHTDNMGGGMMGGSGHMGSDSSGWEHHMEDSHTEGDEHFGGFDTMNHSFNYSFRNPADQNTFIHFEGTKDNNQ